MRSSGFLLAAFVVVAWGAFAVPAARAQEVSCADGLDEDGDGATDCDDTDCWRDAACEQSVTRTISVVRDVPADPNTKWLNIYLLSWPEIPNIPDIGQSSAAGPKGCVGDVPDVIAGDGIIDSLDLLCAIWTAGPDRAKGAMVLSRFDEATCTFRGTSINRTAFGTNVGTVFFPVVPHEGYYVTVSSNDPIAPSYTVTLRGWRDATWRGDSVTSPVCSPPLSILPIPSDSLATFVDEILCGEEGTDWIDADADGDPDTCPNGLFDGTTPISIGTFDNDQSAAPTGNPASANQFVFRSVLRAGPDLAFLGPRIDVTQGDAFILVLRNSQQPASWNDPRR